MLSRAFRLEGLGRQDVHLRLKERLRALGERDDEMLEVDARGLTELLRPTEAHEAGVAGPAYRFSRPGQKYALIRRVLGRMAARRPLILWLDDVQWGPQSVGVIEELFSTVESRPPVLVVCTVRADLVAGDPELGRRLEALWAANDAVRLHLEPLATTDHHALVNRLLSLDPSLAGALAKRTEGNPLFAIQLLRDLVDRGALRAGPRGFEIHEDGGLQVPDDIHQLWLERVQRVVDGSGSYVRQRALWRAMERAAILGRHIGGREWVALCEQVGVDRPRVAQEVLIERGLAERADHGWVFAHGLLMDSLQRHARERLRWRKHHGRCADLLAELYPDRRGQTAGRRAHHRIEAGQLERALPGLVEDHRRLWRAGEIEVAHATMRRHRALLDALDVPPLDGRRLDTEIALVRTGLVLGERHSELIEAIDSLAERADQGGFGRLAMSALTTASAVYRHVGDLAQSRQRASDAVHRARVARDPQQLHQALAALAEAEMISGDLEAARRGYLECYQLAEEVGDAEAMLDGQKGLAWVALAGGEPRRAREIFEGLLVKVRELGMRTVELHCLNGLGESARFEEDVDAARAWQEQYLRLAREINGPMLVAQAQLNLAQVDLMSGDFRQAENRTRDFERRLEAIGCLDAMQHPINVMHLTRAAGAGEWEEFDRRLRPYLSGWPSEARVVRDFPWLLQLAGDSATRAKQFGRAVGVWGVARTLWKRLCDDHAVRRLDDKLARAVQASGAAGLSRVAPEQPHQRVALHAREAHDVGGRDDAVECAHPVEDAEAGGAGKVVQGHHDVCESELDGHEGGANRSQADERLPHHHAAARLEIVGGPHQDGRGKP